MDEVTQERRPSLGELIKDVIKGVQDEIVRGVREAVSPAPLPPVEIYYTIEHGFCVTCLELPLVFKPTSADVEEWEIAAREHRDIYPPRASACHVLRYLIAPDYAHLIKLVRLELGERKFLLRDCTDFENAVAYFPNKIAQ